MSKVTLQDIIDGKGQFIIHGSYRMKEVHGPIVCNDNATLSVQASRTHYSRPRDDEGPYTHVEVGYPSVQPPKTWAQYADGDYPADVYGYVPVKLVKEFVESHGGEK